MLKSKLHLDIHTTLLLEELLKNSNKSPNLTFFSNKYTASKNILNTLDFVYHNPNLFHKYFPAWLYKFIKFKPINKEKKMEFVYNYGSILTFKHLITNFSNNNDNHLYEKYKKKWNGEQIDFYERMYPTNINSKIDDLHSLNFFDNPDSEKLIKLRDHYASLSKTKIRPPELTIKIFPDKFGHPPHPTRIFNMRLHRLIKLQNHFTKNPGISEENLAKLDMLDLNLLNDTTQEAYVIFLQSAFVIQDSGSIKKSSIFAKRVASSSKIEDLYIRARE